MGLENFGTWATLSTVLALVQLSEAGVTAEVTRRIAGAAGRGDDEGLRKAVREGTTLLTCLGFTVALVGTISAGPIVSLVFPDLVGHDRTQVVLVLTGVVLQLAFGLSLAGYFAVLSGLQRTDFASYFGLIARLASLPVLVLLAHLGFGLWTLFLSNLVASVVGWAGMFWAVRRIRPGLSYRLQRPRFHELAPYFGISFVVVAASISNLFDYQFDKLLLTHYRDAETAGIYQIGATLSLTARGFALAPVAVLLAGAAELYGRDPRRLERLEKLLTQVTYALGALLFLAVAAFAPNFVPLWLGPGYGEAVVATQLLSIALFGNLWSAPWYYYAIGRGWLKETAWSALANTTVNASASFVLTQAFGLRGALVGSLAGNAAGVLVFYVLLRRRERRAWLLPALRPTLVVAVTASAAWALTRHEELDWFPLLLLGAAWVVITSSLLLAIKAVPFVVTITGGRLRLGIRER